MRNRPTAVRFLAFSLIAVALAGSVAALLVFTWEGQRLDDLAFEGRKAIRLEVRRLVTAVLRSGTPVGLVLIGGFAVVASLRSGARRRAAACAAVVVAAPLLARLIKDQLVRPELWELTWAKHVNTFPSGHSAAWTAAVLAVPLSVDEPRRGWAVGFGAVALVAHNVAMLWSGWHRPSDVVGAVLLGGAAVGVAGALVGTAGRPAPPRASAWSRDRRAVLAVVVGAVVLPVGAALAVRTSVLNPTHPFGHHLVALAVANAVSVGMLLVLLHIVGPSSLRASDGSIVTDDS